MVSKITETLQGVVTGMAKGHQRPNRQRKRIQKGTKAKQEQIKSLLPHTETRRSLIEMTEMTSGHTGEVLASKQKVPMGHLIHTATNPLVVTTSSYPDEVQLMGAKDFLPVPHITVGIWTRMGLTALQSRQAHTQATRESVPL